MYAGHDRRRDPMDEETLDPSEGGEASSDGSRDALQEGLAIAFGQAGEAAAPPASVIERLRARADVELGVLLDVNDSDPVPVRVTEEVRELRGPAGRYQVLGEIGRGGVGVVYKGRDGDLGRDVAMKVLRTEHARDPAVLARFVEEAQIGGQLQHPGIVPVYELGLLAGERPYFAMKLVKGETLAELLARRRDPAQDRRRLLGVFEQVCQTMAYAHARRVVHRDLKPSNVMIGAFGEVQVVDWGFAKVLAKGRGEHGDPVPSAPDESARVETVRSRSGSGSESMQGALLGTPAYLSPQQALGDVERMDQRSDVFGLGAILCEILTGEPPYRACDGDLVRQATTGALDGAYARLAACGADESLIALCIECLARERDDRPESAAEVAGRVGAYLTSVEERARRAELRAAEVRYRHRATLQAVGAVALVACVGLAAWYAAREAARERRDEAARRMATATGVASAARGRAQAGGLDASLWSAAATTAEQLVALARSDAVDPEDRASAEALLADVHREAEAAAGEALRRARDAAMLERLTTLRILVDEELSARDFDGPEQRRLDAEYAAAFAEYLDGRALLDLAPEEALDGLRTGDIEVALAAALDHWSLARDAVEPTGSGPSAPPSAGDRLRVLAAALDDNPARARLRALLADVASAGPELAELARDDDSFRAGPASCRVLAEALWRADAREACVEVLRRAQATYPQDFDLCFLLALRLDLSRPPQREEAIATYRIAHALRPDKNEVRYRMAYAWLDLGRPERAEETARELLASHPASERWLSLLGVALERQGRLELALEHYRRAIETDPGFAPAHNNLAAALVKRGDLDSGMDAYRRALELAPEEPKLYHNLGSAQVRAERYEEALETFEAGLDLSPDYADIHMWKGLALEGLERADEALASYARAVEIDPGNAPAYLNMANELRERGEAAAALEAYERAHALFEPRADAFSRHWARYAGERIAELRRAPHLERVLAGSEAAESPEDWAAAVMAGYHAGRHADVVALTEATLASAPELLGDTGWGAYNSACSAALLAASPATDVDADLRERASALAREWLAREVESWCDALERGGTGAADVRARLRQALQDPDFAGVRGDGPGVGLPDSEREAWSSLWERIERAAVESER